MVSKASRMSVNHAAGIFADMSVDGPAIGTLVAIIDRAKNLPNRKTMGKQNPYCAARLGKEARKTETDLRGGQTPKWDQELRFTVHESPDYFRLKVTVFNDDKRTDLIGETWVDLKDLIIPGGSQSDAWHPLQYRGRYAGDVRIEMTYYDTRPEDEAVIERRTQAAEKVHGKSAPSVATSSSISSNSAASAPIPVGNSALSGPRQLKDVKRRPLPTDPTGSAPARPGPPEKAPSAPLPLPAQVTPPRPMHEPPSHSYSTPPAEYMRHAPRHSMASEPVYDAQPMPVQAPPASRPMRTYETPDDFHREWSHPAAPPLQPQAPPRRHPQEAQAQYSGYRDAYDSRSHARPRSGYGNPPPVDYRSSRQEIPVSRPEQFPEMHVPVTEPPRPSSHHSNYAFPTEAQHYAPNGDMMVVHGAPPARYTSRSSGASMHDHGAVEYIPAVPNGMALEPVDHYRGRGRSRSHSNSLVHEPSNSAMRHAEYATMQPRVEDEDDDGPPPPPPVHRSGVHSSPNHANNHVQQLVPSPTPSYQAYSPEYAPSPRNSFDLTHLNHPNHPLADADRLPLPTSTPSMPPSLVAGFDPAIADAESDRAASERVAVRRRSAIFDDDDPICPPSRDPSPGPAMMPPYPVEAASSAPHLPVSAPAPPIENPHQALVTTRRSFHSDSRLVPRRKSVSPHPHPSPLPPAGTMPLDRDPSAPITQTPFSPDSYDQFNPNAARAAVTRDLAPAYDTPAEAMHAARRSEAEAARPGGDSGPIIGDDGREIDPSDHLPTDTWAPEPERKKKTGVVVRFKKSPASAARTSPRPATATAAPVKEYHRPPAPSSRPTSSYGAADVDMRGRPGYAPPAPVSHTYSSAHARTYSTPSPRSVRSRSSVSPAPSGHSGSHSPSSFYAPAPHGPPIPAKVPIAQPMPVGQSRALVSSGDALSRELGTIDIGSVGCTTGRAMRRYVPRVQTGYAM
ncbi:hypothetical protein P170DRAFT_512460 [Aspergillus steynii IBT 23096]|uniref:C2 domain-containing protein n=1 Tax=Aspergillus steynii IBT 23096 TaxID=1392250 RepID=A0A2I2FYX3_9EURO|nr:uncharacterized protein P170DRAFT_512460 [Aspergillus steynii IBT 23096]PLB45843.1 hypothetical protein P170DRAFT_512460 [Aspergillus steynii IBT 23096]